MSLLTSLNESPFAPSKGRRVPGLCPSRHSNPVSKYAGQRAPHIPELPATVAPR